MQVVALIAALVFAAPAKAACIDDDSCPYRCARQRDNKPDAPKYCSACCVGVTELHPEEAAPQVVFDRPRMAVIGRHLISIYELPAGAAVAVDGKKADGPLASAGKLVMPDVEPKRVLSFAEPLARPKRPQRNGQRFLACTDARGPRLPSKGKDSHTRFCGVLDLKGEPVYAAPAPEKNGWAEALALSEDGHEAAFEYGKKGAVDSYVIWSESVGSKRYKADPKDMQLRRALERLGVNENFPE